ncbi:MAG: hypothetical protein PHQ96_05445 [Candidatus Omnitrophica bacterium]|nr:hypothetical protein [Candidatus Omnitrophota bacterium]
MKAKSKAKKAAVSSKAKKGEKYVCDSCGMIVAVDKGCSCEACDIVCCGQDMQAVTCR